MPPGPGVSRGTLHALLSTHHAATRPRVRTGTAQRIRQVTAVSQHPAVVDSTGAKGRLHALIANGWSMARLATYLHCHPSTISRLLRGTTITGNIDHTSRDTYTRLADQARAHHHRRRAQQRRRRPPLRRHSRLGRTDPHQEALMDRHNDCDCDLLITAQVACIARVPSSAYSIRLVSGWP